MQGRVAQLSISKGGLPKFAVSEAWAGPLGLEGDVQRNRKYHGGPAKALLLVSAEDIAELAAAGYPIGPGALGENLTIEGLDFRRLRAGQRFLAGGAVLELTTLRRPCANLDPYNSDPHDPIQKRLYDELCKSGDASSPRWAMGGFYAAVLQPGLIRMGDIIALADQKA
jgi:MOSC domain-containing protein YiiM